MRQMPVEGRPAGWGRGGEKGEADSSLSEAEQEMK